MTEILITNLKYLLHFFAISINQLALPRVLLYHSQLHFFTWNFRIIFNSIKMNRLRYTNNQNTTNVSDKRISMPMITEQERRASIKSVMADKSMSPLEKRRSIQGLMDGRRSSAGCGVTVCQPCQPVTHAMNPEVLDAARRMEESRPSCNHYERNCSIVSPCCGAVFGCRLCHDECSVLPPPKYGVQKNGRPEGKVINRCSSLPSSFTGAPEPEHHNIDRFAIREIICRNCYTRQSSKA